MGHIAACSGNAAHLNIIQMNLFQAKKDGLCRDSEEGCRGEGGCECEEGCRSSGCCAFGSEESSRREGGAAVAVERARKAAKAAAGAVGRLHPTPKMDEAWQEELVFCMYSTIYCTFRITVGN